MTKTSIFYLSSLKCHTYSFFISVNIEMSILVCWFSVYLHAIFTKVIFFMHGFRFKMLMSVFSFSEKQSGVHWKCIEEKKVLFFPISTVLPVFPTSNAFIYTQFVLEKLM